MPCAFVFVCIEFNETLNFRLGISQFTHTHTYIALLANKTNTKPFISSVECNQQRRSWRRRQRSLLTQPLDVAMLLLSFISRTTTLALTATATPMRTPNDDGTAVTASTRQTDTYTMAQKLADTQKPKRAGRQTGSRVGNGHSDKRSNKQQQLRVFYV